jgi:polar amino acid transport system substrate-binding protein
MRLVIISVFLIFVALIGFSNLSLFQPMSDKKSNILKAGYSNEAPYAYLDPEGNVTGIFPMVLQENITALGYNSVDWVLLSFNELIPALQSKRIDVIAAGLTISAKRSAQLCFAAPLVSSKSGLLWLKTNSKYKPEKPIASQTLTVATLAGAIEENYISQHDNFTQLRVPDVHFGVLSLIQKKADLLVLTEPALKAIVAKYPHEFQVKQETSIFPHMHYAAFAFSKEKSDLLSLWNRLQQNTIKKSYFQSEVEQSGLSTLSIKDDLTKACYSNEY